LPFHPEHRISLSGWFPELVEFLFCNDFVLQKATVTACSDLAVRLSDLDCQELLAQLNFTRPSPADQFMFACVTARSPQIVPDDHHGDIIAFLMRAAREAHPASSLAAVILLNGLPTWLETDPETFIKLLELAFGRHFLPEVYAFFSEVVVADDEFFLASLKKLIPKILPNPEFVKQLCELINRDAFQRALGSKGTLILAKIGAKNPRYADKVAREITKQQQQLRNVARVGNVTVIGISTGFVYVFRAGKKVGKWQLFNGQVSIVSINPEVRWAVAVSFDDAQMKRFDISEVKQRRWTGGPEFITTAIKCTDRTKSGVWTSATEYVL
jgi:hypothetical protein